VLHPAGGDGVALGVGVAVSLDETVPVALASSLGRGVCVALGVELGASVAKGDSSGGALEVSDGVSLGVNSGVVLMAVLGSGLGELGTVTVSVAVAAAESARSRASRRERWVIGPPQWDVGPFFGRPQTLSSSDFEVPVKIDF
jgi:hypothetical protein